MKAKKPLVSVVVCCYNGADVLPDCLAALNSQDYDGKLEIIVVDDGSADDTSAVAESSGVKLIRNEVNLGLAASRNVGWRAAEGRIILFTDDDCRPAVSWVREIVTAYDSPDIQGVGGAVKATNSDGIVLRYLHQTNPLAPLEADLAKSTGLVYRFGAYLQKLIRPNHLKGRRKVVSFAGANMSFRRTALEMADGFDSRFRFGAEEEDFCKRVRQRYPEGLLFVPEAKVAHKYERSLRDTLRRSKAYAKGSARMHLKHADVLPLVYPFPFLIGAAFSLGLVHPALFTAPLLLPLFIYLRWPLLAVRRLWPEPILYAYIQLLQEIWSNLGFAIGRWQYRSMFKGVVPRPSPASSLRFIVVVVVLTMAGIMLHLWNGTPARLPLALLAVGLPGYLVWRAIGLGRKHTPLVFRAALCAVLGLAWLLVATVFAVSVLPYFNIARPLEATPLGWTLIGSIGLLLPFALRQTVVLLKRPRHIAWDVVVIALSIPAMLMGMFVGAGLLNNGQSNVMVLCSLLMGVGLLVLTALRAYKLPTSMAPLVLFAVSLTVLWSYTFRSTLLFGWDIQQEYAVLQATQKAGHWLMSQPHSPYDAMLSVTTLPAALANLSGLSALSVYKVLYPIFFSLVPVVLYMTYRVFASRTLAFVGAGVFLAQFPFAQQFSATARQQLAFLFFTTLLYALLQHRVKGMGKIFLILAAIFGLVVSHYSTTYVAIALIGGAYLGSKVVSFWWHSRGKQPIEPSAYLKGGVVLALVLAAIAWYGPVTHMSASYRAVVTAYTNPGHLVDNVRTFFHSENAPEKTTVDDTQYYLNVIGDKYQKERPYLSYYEAASNDSVLTISSIEIETRFPILHKLSVFFEATMRIAWWILGGVAIVIVLVKGFLSRRRQQLELGLLGGAALTGFVLIHVVPGADAFYNISRLNQQCLMFILLPAVVAIAWWLRSGGIVARTRSIIFGGVLGVSLLFAAGLVSQALGGTPSANLNNFGSDYQRFYIVQSDVDAVRWLDENYQKGTPIYADRYAQLHFTSHSNQRKGDDLLWDITPETLSEGSFVYADETNIKDRIATGKAGEGYTYQFPNSFLKKEKNILYSNGSAEIYR